MLIRGVADFEPAGHARKAAEGLGEARRIHAGLQGEVGGRRGIGRIVAARHPPPDGHGCAALQVQGESGHAFRGLHGSIRSGPTPIAQVFTCFEFTVALPLGLNGRWLGRQGQGGIGVDEQSAFVHLRGKGAEGLQQLLGLAVDVEVVGLH